MSSTFQESSSNDLAQQRMNKPDKTRRSWSTKEEDVLIVLLKGLVADGWKSDNGFKAGYLNKLEEGMRQEFPGTDLKGLPHINSKISIWKKNYYTLSLILGKSGVGFNVDGTHMIDCTNEVWAEVMKCDANAKNMRRKSWPLLEDWKEVFGKDRANGENAEDLMEAVNDMYRGGDTPEVAQTVPNPIDVEDAMETDTANDSFCQSKRSVDVGKGRSKKRKRDDELARVYAMLAEVTHNTNARMDNLSNRIGYEFDLGKARKEIFEQLGFLSDLSMDDKIDVCEALAREVAMLEVFLGLPSEAKECYVRRILVAKGK